MEKALYRQLYENCVDKPYLKKTEQARKRSARMGLYRAQSLVNRMEMDGFDVGHYRTSPQKRADGTYGWN